jgi:hypothetical protein
VQVAQRLRLGRPRRRPCRRRPVLLGHRRGRPHEPGVLEDLADVAHDRALGLAVEGRDRLERLGGALAGPLRGVGVDDPDLLLREDRPRGRLSLAEGDVLGDGRDRDDDGHDEEDERQGCEALQPGGALGSNVRGQGGRPR